MAIFGPKPWVNPFGKMSISRLFQLVLFIVQKVVFSFQNIVKIFSWPLLPKNKKVEKQAIFGPKPWVNPFGKMSIFRLFDLLVFIAQKGVFSIQNIVKDIFLAYFKVKKKVPKKDIFVQKPWINPFRKMAIFRLFKLLVFIAQKGVFSF